MTGLKQFPARPRPRPDDPRSGRVGWRAALCAGCVTGIGAVCAGAFAGMWYLPFLAGLVMGLILRGRLTARLAFALACLVPLAGWTAALLVRAWPQGQPVAAVARTIGALAGLPPAAVVVLAATLLVAVLQGAAGWWLGWAVSGVIPIAVRRD